MLNKKSLKTKKILTLLLLAGLMLLLAGCQRNVDAEGHTLPEKIIYLTTTWGEMFKNEGLLTCLIVYPLAQCINFLAKYLNVGLAIVLTAILLHLILLKVTAKSTVASQKMQVLQPELQKIQQKYEGRTDSNAQQAQAMEMQKLYQKYDINPLTTMIMPFIQLPILICMYYAVQRADAVVNGTLFGVNLTTTPNQALALHSTSGYLLFGIYVLMIVAQFFSMKITKWMADAKNKKDHKVRDYDKKTSNTQASMQMMTYMMLVMVALFGFNWPTAMSLYWLISSLISVLKTVYVQKRYIENA